MGVLRSRRVGSKGPAARCSRKVGAEPSAQSFLPSIGSSLSQYGSSFNADPVSLSGMMDADILKIRREPDLVVLTMNRPPANALNYALIARLLEEIRRLESEPDPPGIVLTGEGDRFFSAGGDIREVTGLQVAAPRIRFFHAVLCAFERYPGPVVCAVRGYAVGGALEFLLHSDHVIADHRAQIGFPEINHGLLPVAKGMRQAALRLGKRAAQVLLYSGVLVDAGKAMQIGAFDEVVNTDAVLDRAIDVCRDFRSKDPKLFAAIKRSLNLTGQLSDDQLEQMTVDDLGQYLDNDDSADARARFLARK
ncbi:enoyl-CoA hydratase/carnithine racemase [Bradyrhizobium yuanmingense]|uniref:Enoyl-CoA hydratase/carnithine racemase n=2 Tax=Bradyrhizobium yuanmingense TaxID=108015 RepID=A0ABV4GN37_9BRAD